MVADVSRGVCSNGMQFYYNWISLQPASGTISLLDNNHQQHHHRPHPWPGLKYNYASGSSPHYQRVAQIIIITIWWLCYHNNLNDGIVSSITIAGNRNKFMPSTLVLLLRCIGRCIFIITSRESSSFLCPLTNFIYWKIIHYSKLSLFVTDFFTFYSQKL